MTFEHWWVLLLLPLPVAWVARQWRRTSRRTGLLLKGLTAAMVLLALAQPVLSIWETKMAVAVLVDTSASVSPKDLERASRIADEIERGGGRNLVRVMPFAARVRPATPAEHDGGWAFRQAAGAAGRSTNLEAALLDAVSAMPAGLVPRIVLITDGNQNAGSASRAAWQAREAGIPIDTYLMQGRSRPALRLDAVSFPSLTFAGERFPIELTVHAPAETHGVVTIAAEGRRLGSSEVTLKAGLNDLRVRASINLPGAFDVSGSLDAGAAGTVRFAQAVTVRSPRVLFVSQDPPGTETDLLGALRAASFEVTQETGVPPDQLDNYQTVILNNCDLEGLPEHTKSALRDYVRGGGGLLVIGGERNVYVEDPLKKEDPLEQALPAKLVPPRSPEGTCVVLIIDKSSSMEGRKMELARLSAIGVIDNLRPEDRVGVLIFDNSFQWAVPIRKAENRTLIKRLIAGITPDGGTQIAPALAEAFRRILPVKATYKHIVLLTDGISEEGDSISLAEEASTRKVTISTVGLGQDVNRAYLEKVATLAKGKAYFLTDPSGLARILLRDVMEHTGQTAVEKSVVPVIAHEDEVLAPLHGLDFPPLDGYVRYKTKPSGETILKFPSSDPLLARWQYGLGRVAVFTSDAKSRWASQWVGWPGFDLFWTALLRDLLPHALAGDATVNFDRANRELVVDYRLVTSRIQPGVAPEIFVFGPDGFREPLETRKLASGAYRGVVSVDDRRGLFRVRSLEESAAFPETGIYLQEAELNDFGSSPKLVRQIAEFTGGRFEPDPKAVFDTGGRAVASTMDLWPGLLLLALLLNLVELGMRKWRAVIAPRSIR